jgi:hypothetical protein
MFVPAQVRGNNHWNTSLVRLKILNYHTLLQLGILRNLDRTRRKSGLAIPLTVTLRQYLSSQQCTHAD